MLLIPLGIGVVFGVMAVLLPSRVAKLVSGMIAASLVWGYRSTQAATAGELPSGFMLLSLAIASAVFATVWFLALSFKKAKPKKS